MYYVYHVKDIKIGCTNEWPKRVIDQGFNLDNCEILFTSDDGWKAGDKEIELQKQYSYRVDTCHYMTSRENWRKAGIKGGEANVKSGHLDRVRSKEGASKGGKASKGRGKRPHACNSEGGKATASIERTCPKCGYTMKGPGYFRHHGENCTKQVFH